MQREMRAKGGSPISTFNNSDFTVFIYTSKNFLIVFFFLISSISDVFPRLYSPNVPCSLKASGLLLLLSQLTEGTARKECISGLGSDAPVAL